MLSVLWLLSQDIHWQTAYFTTLVVAPSWVALGYRLHRHNPQLFVRRAQVGQGVPDWDRPLATLAKFAILGTLVLGALQHSPWNPLLFALGFVLWAAGWAVLAASQRANPFFEGMVRHQVEHQHQVVDAGPYAKVRHPGYLGFLLADASLALMLASSWAAAGTLVLALTLGIRMGREERFLAEKLDGYRDYCKRVRFRLIPGLF